MFLKDVHRFVIFLFSISGIFLAFNSCTVPRYAWPQKDMPTAGINEENFPDRVLIASRSSEFKDEVVGRILETYSDKQVYFKITGIEQLQNVNPSEYSAVVIINTCIAWAIDRRVDAFVQRYPDYSGLIVLTTSSDGEWKPDADTYHFDALTSASVLEDAGKVSRQISLKVNNILRRK